MPPIDVVFLWRNKSAAMKMIIEAHLMDDR